MIVSDGRCEPVRLTKHHGQGNDFLVLLDREDRLSITPGVVVTLCDRRRGVGADGFIRAVPDEEADFSRPYEVAAVMELFNADGSRAEMSGNGVRCLGQALWDSGWAHGDEVLVRTDAGMRKLLLGEMGGGGIASVSVTMGTIVVGDDVVSLEWMDGASREAVARARTADAGNPHLVLQVGRLDAVDLDGIGVAAQRAFPRGINVEVVQSDGASGRLDIAVFERGVGRTLACGTGSCAVAAVARAWGLAGTDGGAVTVANPGGDLWVRWEGEEAILGGPVVRIAEVTVDGELFAP